MIDDIDDETDETDRDTSWRIEERTSRNSKNAGLGALILPNSLTQFCVELQTMTIGVFICGRLASGFNSSFE